METQHGHFCFLHGHYRTAQVNKKDELLPSEIQEQWNQMRADIRPLKDSTLQRCMVPSGKIRTAQLRLSQIHLKKPLTR